jgi:hypothetical protein
MSAPTLLGFLANQIITPVTRKALFSDDYVFFGEYMPCAQFLYETGAILGYTFHDRLIVFVELFTEPGHQSHAVEHIATLATSRLAGRSEEPEDFVDLFFKPEAERLMTILRSHGLTNYSEWLDFPKAAKQKMPIKDIFPTLQATAWEGVGLGSRYPELTERLLLHTEDIEVWHDAHAHGLDIPASPPTPKTIRERQTEAIAMIKPYIEKARPDLLMKLGL